MAQRVSGDKAVVPALMCEPLAALEWTVAPHPRGLIAQALQDETMKREDLCVCAACGTHGTAGPAVLKIQRTCRHEPRER